MTLKDALSVYPNFPPDIEVFAEIKGFEGIYEIGNWGSIKSVERTFIKNKRGGKEKMSVYLPERIRTRRYNPNGYLRTALWLNGAVKHFNVHRLVAIHFIPNKENLPQVLHIDDNPSNARWDNLRWGTQSDNIYDCVKKKRGFVGSKNGNSKLTETDVIKIKKMLLDGQHINSIAPIFNITKGQILLIKQGRAWNHVN